MCLPSCSIAPIHSLLPDLRLLVNNVRQYKSQCNPQTVHKNNEGRKESLVCAYVFFKYCCLFFFNHSESFPGLPKGALHLVWAIYEIVELRTDMAICGKRWGRRNSTWLKAWWTFLLLLCSKKKFSPQSQNEWRVSGEFPSKAISLIALLYFGSSQIWISKHIEQISSNLCPCYSPHPLFPPQTILKCQNHQQKLILEGLLLAPTHLQVSTFELTQDHVLQA